MSACPREILALNISMAFPMFRRKGSAKSKRPTQISIFMEELKFRMRSHFGPQIVNYTYDIAFHAGDNELVHTRHIDALLAKLGALQSCGAEVALSVPPPPPSSQPPLPAPPRRTLDKRSSVRVVKTLAPSSSPSPLPDIRDYLRTICDVPHAVCKMDGQPAGFPRSITRGGGVDIITSSAEQGARLQQLTVEFFRHAKCPVTDDYINLH